MEVHVNQGGGATVVSVAGKLDALSAPECERVMRNLVSTGNVRLVMDLGGLEYISSAGLRVVLSIGKLVKAVQRRLVLARPGGNVADVLEVAGFSHLFPLFDSVEAASEACFDSAAG